MEANKKSFREEALAYHAEGRPGKIEVIPEWVEIIRFVYDNICAYRPYRAIIRDCNERWGKEIFFYESSVYAIAKQPIYCGYQYNSQGELIKNVQISGQEFISFEQWQEVQKIISQKRAKYHVKAKKHWLPLSGRLYCFRYLLYFIRRYRQQFCSEGKGRLE